MQDRWDIRCEWSRHGIDTTAGNAVAIIVDVLSFSTAVTIAVERGASVFPWAHDHACAVTFARQRDAIVAAKRSVDAPSLSPASLRSIERDTRLVLPSPNGSRLSIHAARIARAVAVACLRNAQAVATWAMQQGPPIAVIPAGEQWPDGSVRFAIEDLLGAGAVIAAISGNKSPEALAAEAVFRQTDVAEAIRAAASGRELIERGFADDVELAIARDVSTVVPVLRDNSAFTQ
jgi:2-phosphosulfolactate phosphatase